MTNGAGRSGTEVDEERVLADFRQAARERVRIYATFRASHVACAETPTSSAKGSRLATLVRRVPLAFALSVKGGDG